VETPLVEPGRMITNLQSEENPVVQTELEHLMEMEEIRRIMS